MEYLDIYEFEGKASILGSFLQSLPSKASFFLFCPIPVEDTG